MQHPPVEINAGEDSGWERGWAGDPLGGRDNQTSPCTLNGNDLTRCPVAV
jgi:hypothetical protein